MTQSAELSTVLLEDARKRIEARIVAAMEAVYRDPLHPCEGPFDPARELPASAFPGLKPVERIVCFFDYAATGVSVLAPLAAAGDARATALVRLVVAQARCYVDRIWRTWRRDDAGDALWDTPLRRLLAHLGLAWPYLARLLSADELQALRVLLTSQVEAAIEHNHGFWPGVRGWLFLPCNNHTAIFAQGIWLCGRALGRDDWVARMEDFAERYLDDMHPDGYFDENAQPERLGGPSMVYTPLTAGCLFDILDGRHRRQPPFLKAGRFYRRFLDADYGPIPLADERTNVTGRPSCYGLALHTLAPEGRGMVRELLEGSTLIDHASPEALAVLHHEIGLMVSGETEVPENHRDGDVRITLPIGVLRRADWTATLCGLRATNRAFCPRSDYALDQQSHVYLSHHRLGLLLPGTKGKNNPALSTFRRGDDAYTVATGELLTSPERFQVTVHYRTFDARIVWTLAPGEARLHFESECPDELVATVPITAAGEAALRFGAPHEFASVPGFSPYAPGGRDAPVRALVCRWRGSLDLSFTL